MLWFSTGSDRSVQDYLNQNILIIPFFNHLFQVKKGIMGMFWFSMELYRSAPDKSIYNY